MGKLVVLLTFVPKTYARLRFFFLYFLFILSCKLVPKFIYFLLGVTFVVSCGFFFGLAIMPHRVLQGGDGPAPRVPGRRREIAVNILDGDFKVFDGKWCVQEIIPCPGCSCS